MKEAPRRAMCDESSGRSPALEPIRSRLRLVVQNPSQLFVGVGNRGATRSLDRRQRIPRLPSKMDESASCDGRRPADAATAMEADFFSSAQAPGKGRDECAKAGYVGRDVNIANRVGEKVQPNFLGQLLFLTEPEPDCFVWLKQRDEGADARLLDVLQVVPEPIVAARTKHDRELYGWISFNPENLVCAFESHESDDRRHHGSVVPKCTR